MPGTFAHPLPAARPPALHHWRWFHRTRRVSRHRPSAKEIGLALWNELTRDGGAIDAGALLAYYTVLALFPFALLALSLVAFVPLHGLDRQLVGLIWQAMPHDVAKLCTDILHEVVGKQHGVVLLVALIGAVWTTSGAVSAAMQTLNHTWDVRETRPYWRAKARSLLVTISGVVLLIIGAAALLLFSHVGRAIMTAAGVAAMPTPVHTVTGVVVRNGIVCVAMLALTSFSYRVLPNLHGRRTVLPGALFATASWVLVSLGFGLYLAHVASYAKVYGALGTAVVLLTWLYLSSMVLILGGAINASFDHAAHGTHVVPKDHRT